ncbi:MAG: nitrile hydratase subunit alpha [bacterium]|nr:nitrile hydratase subunit alpha [bacterium]
MSHDHPHRHPPQADHREPVSHYEWLGVALNELLMEKGLYTAQELREMMAEVEAVEPSTHGARVVARAWVDEDFRVRLLKDANTAVEALGFDSAATDLTVLENTDEIHNVVVCTLCSCYPRSLLGRPPTWYKSASYRSRLVREPRSVLREFGTQLPDNVTVRVHDSTAELRYLVLPLRPQGTDDWTEERLAELVTRDSMIGVTTARTP